MDLFLKCQRFRAIIDDVLKKRIHCPGLSKFRTMPRCRKKILKTGRTRLTKKDALAA